MYLLSSTKIFVVTALSSISSKKSSFHLSSAMRCVPFGSMNTCSCSYNSKFYDVCTFIDNSDPLQVIVSSTGGDVFKNGVGTTVLTAVCYQAGVEVDAAGSGSYTWTKYDKNGAIDTAWGTNGTKTGKTLSVSTSDVDTKATFMVVVNI